MDKKAEFMESYIEGWNELTETQRRDIWSSLSVSTRELAIIEDLKEFGMGNNNFMFTEIGCEDDANKKFKNIYEYDKANWEFQREAMLEQGAKNVEEEYELTLHGDWVRLMVGDELVMGCVQSLSSYIYDVIEEYIRKLAGIYIPNEISMESGAPDAKGLIPCNITNNAHGRDEEYKIFRTKEYEYTTMLYKRYKNEVPKIFSGVTFIKTKKDHDGGSFTTFVISDIDAAKKITVQNFYNDIKELEKEWGTVKLYIKKEKQKVLLEMSSWFKLSIV